MGFVVGFAVGANVGNGVGGVNVGDSVGVLVGTDGLLVGCPVGCEDGSIVGASVGPGVGNHVGVLCGRVSVTIASRSNSKSHIFFIRNTGNSPIVYLSLLTPDRYNPEYLLQLLTPASRKITISSQR